MERQEPSVGKMFRRGLTRRCPQCGGTKSFIKHWLGRYERCQTCGIAWHREHGFELGPTALNVVFTFFCLGAGMGIAFVATAPDFPVFGLTVGTIAAAIILPLVIQPFTATTWLAFDLAVHRPDARELAEAAAAVSAKQDA